MIMLLKCMTFVLQRDFLLFEALFYSHEELNLANNHVSLEVDPSLV